MGARVRRFKIKSFSFGGKVLLASSLAVPSIVTVAQTPALAGDCTNSSVMHVWTERFGGGHLQIRVIPTNKARSWGTYSATNEIWRSVQQCVGGLYGARADGVYQQIECHVRGARYAYPWAGGYSWDFETWRTPISWDVAYATQCNWGGTPYSRL